MSSDSQAATACHMSRPIDSDQAVRDLLTWSREYARSLAPQISSANLEALIASTVRMHQDSWRLNVEAMEESFRRRLPDNWHAMESDPLNVIDVITDTGLCLVWAPRAEVVDAIVAEPETSSRVSLLALQREAVLADLEATLNAAGEVDLPGHADASLFAREALTEGYEGHFPAAQALAACGIGQILHETWGWEILGRAFKTFKDKHREAKTVQMVFMKVTLLQACTARALSNYNEVSPDEGFNRHATQHGERAFFSASNALAAMLLLVGWLRELKWLVEHPDVIVRNRQAAGAAGTASSISSHGAA